MSLKEGLEVLVDKAKRNLARGLTIAALTSTLGITTLYDNVHFALGSLRLEHVKGTHYVLGLYPKVYIESSSENTDVYVIGLLGSEIQVENEARVKNAYNVWIGLKGQIKVGSKAKLERAINIGVGIVESHIELDERAEVDEGLYNISIAPKSSTSLGLGTRVEGMIVNEGINGVSRINIHYAGKLPEIVVNGGLVLWADVSEEGLDLRKKGLEKLYNVGWISTNNGKSNIIYSLRF